MKDAHINTERDSDTKRGSEMYLWWVCFDLEEWGSFVVAPNRGRAKSMFFRAFDDGWEEWTDIRARKIKEADGYTEMVLDTGHEPELQSLGVSYVYDEEADTT